MNNSKERLTKEDAFKILDNINMWIGNCDSKASVILAAIGIITSVTFTSEIFKPLCSIVIDSFSKSGWSIIISSILWLSIIFIVAGVILFIMTISPRLRYSYRIKKKEKPQYDSIMFYGIVSELEFDSYKKKADTITEEQIMDDLYFQITSASKICKTKFLHMKRGIMFFSIGFMLFIISTIVFLILK